MSSELDGYNFEAPVCNCSQALDMGLLACGLQQLLVRQQQRQHRDTSPVLGTSIQGRCSRWRAADGPLLPWRGSPWTGCVTGQQCA